MTNRVPEWHPNRNKIAFDSWLESDNDIYIMKTDGSEQTRLRYNPGYDLYVNWDHKGKDPKN